jgi:uncharacterized protein with GYD domain
MAKYAFMGGYTAETWAEFIQNPGDRRQAIQRACEAVGASLDVNYWTFGEDDFLVIIEAPDDNAAAAVAVAVGSSGALRNTRTVKLIEAAEINTILEKAKAVAGVYEPPGARQPAGVR